VDENIVRDFDNINGDNVVTVPSQNAIPAARFPQIENDIEVAAWKGWRHHLLRWKVAAESVRMKGRVLEKARTRNAPFSLGELWAMVPIRQILVSLRSIYYIILIRTCCNWFGF
jgi:hypothetical protein